MARALPGVDASVSGKGRDVVGGGNYCPVRVWGVVMWWLCSWTWCPSTGNVSLI